MARPAGDPRLGSTRDQARVDEQLARPATPPAPPATTSAKCALHRRHDPAPTYQEIHHIVPQAWQAAWQPPQPWEHAGPSRDRPGQLLWDARTVAICRTGHGNVHFWLVRLTKAAYRLGSIGAGLHELRAEARVEKREPGRRDLETAILGLRRWLDAGGTLDQLAAHRLWGEI